MDRHRGQRGDRTLRLAEVVEERLTITMADPYYTKGISEKVLHCRQDASANQNVPESVFLNLEKYGACLP